MTLFCSSCDNTAAVPPSRQLERLAELGVLTGHLAHELRNPLSTVKINLQLLAEDILYLARQTEEKLHDAPANPDQKRALQEQLKSYQRQLRKIDTVTKETNRLADTLTDFLKYAGHLELHPQQASVNEILDELIDFYEPQALANHVQIRHFLTSESTVCCVDVDLLKQALLNLFINAAQAMEQGGELIVRTAVHDSMLQIDVIDTGPGISIEDQEKIFVPYYTKRSGGTGLGLPTCRRIVEEHQGVIKLVSEPGKGSNFIILLPLMSKNTPASK